MSARARLPLNALRVFEAAARLSSFTLAAAELAITPGAVSRQIKALEAELGLRLFDRFNRAVRLTDAGLRLAAGVEDGLSRIEAAVERARPRPDGPLVVSVLHSFAVKWLVPRLQRFYERHPGVEVLVSASDRPVDLVREADVAIRVGRGPYRGLSAQRLFWVDMFPVCSPRLLEGPEPLRTPADLARASLLHDDHLLDGEPSWSAWLKMAGADDQVDGAKGARFSNTYLSIEAAMSGRGVVLAHEVLAIDDLASGRLARPFREQYRSPFSYWALCLPERADQPSIRRFRQWVWDEVRADGLPVD